MVTCCRGEKKTASPDNTHLREEGLGGISQPIDFVQGCNPPPPNEVILIFKLTLEEIWDSRAE